MEGEEVGLGQSVSENMAIKLHWGVVYGAGIPHASQTRNLRRNEWRMGKEEAAEQPWRAEKAPRLRFICRHHLGVRPKGA